MADTINKLEQDSLAVASETGYRRNTSFRIGNLFYRFLQFLRNITGGTYLLGEKDNEAIIKAIIDPIKGDTWRAKDTGHYWTYDGKQWNDIGEILPSDTIRRKDLFAKADRSLALLKGFTQVKAVSFDQADDRYFHYGANEFMPGNGIFKSITLDASGIGRIYYKTEIISSDNKLAVVTFLGDDGKIIADAESYTEPFNKKAEVEGYAETPLQASKIVIAWLAGKKIEAQTYSGHLIDNATRFGYSVTEEVGFSSSDNSYINSDTGEIKPGNNAIRSVTKPLNGKNFVRYRAELVNSANPIHLLTYRDDANNIILAKEPFKKEGWVQGLIGNPPGATQITIAYRVGKTVEVQLLSGEPVDDTIRESKLRGELNKIESGTVLKDYTKIEPVSFADPLDRFTEYINGKEMPGNGLINSVKVMMKDVKKVQYDMELVSSGNMAAGIIFFDEYRNMMGYYLPFKTNGVQKGEIVPPANAYEAEFTWMKGKRIFVNLIKGDPEDTTVRKKLKVVKNVSFDNPDDFFYHFQSSNVVPGNNIIRSVTIDLTDEYKFIEYEVDLKQSTSAVAVITYLGNQGKVIAYEQKYDAAKRLKVLTGIHPDAKKVVFSYFVGSYISVQMLSNSYVDDYVREHEIAEIAEKVNNYHSIARSLYDSPKIGESQVGNFRLVCNVKKPQTYNRLSSNNISYTDVNKCKAQFDLINGSPKIIQDRMLNKMKAERISFTPQDDGFVRILVGKDSQDRFYTAYIPSYRKGARGDAKESKLEVTTDFKNFKTIWKGVSGTDTEGISIVNYINPEPMQVKELGNGNLLIAAAYTRSDLPDNDGIAAKANQYSGYFILSEDHSTISLCKYADLNGVIKPMNSTHHVINGSTSYSNQQFYDWSTYIYNNIVVATEYGDRENAGIVWYSEDNGESFKQIFWMPNHYQDGVTNGDTVTYTHIHGVMYDHYRSRIYIIAGEANSNLFWSDKGIATTDSDWTVENIRRQTRYPHLSYMQVVNGYPFRDCLIYGSDFTNMGAFMRVNREKEGVAQQMEVAHEILPQIYQGTLYCAGGFTRRDQNSPVLMCMTRENAMPTPEQQKEHMRQHLGRVVATYDGFNFFEIWLDDTFGSYEVFNMKTWKTESWEFAKCTRDMTAWLCNNGDIVIKPSGRPHFYGDASYEVVLHGDFPSEVYIYRNVERLL